MDALGGYRHVIHFGREMLCISAAYAVMWSLSVRMSPSCILYFFTVV